MKESTIRYAITYDIKQPNKKAYRKTSMAEANTKERAVKLVLEGLWFFEDIEKDYVQIIDIREEQPPPTAAAL